MTENEVPDDLFDEGIPVTVADCPQTSVDS